MKNVFCRISFYLFICSFSTIHAMEKWSLDNDDASSKTSEAVRLLHGEKKHNKNVICIEQMHQEKKIQKELKRNIRALPTELQCHIFYDLDDLTMPTLCRLAHDMRLSPESIKKVECAHHRYINDKSIIIDRLGTVNERFRAYGGLIQEIIGFMKPPHGEVAYKNFGKTWSDVRALNDCLNGQYLVDIAPLKNTLRAFVERTRTQVECFYSEPDCTDEFIRSYLVTRHGLIDFFGYRFNIKVNRFHNVIRFLTMPKYIVSFGLTGSAMWLTGDIFECCGPWVSAGSIVSLGISGILGVLLAFNDDCDYLEGKSKLQRLLCSNDFDRAKIRKAFSKAHKRIARIQSIPSDENV